MQPDVHTELLKRLKAEYGLKEKGRYLQEGKCPACGKNELWAGAERPWTLRCGRENRCGETFQVKQLYPDIFDIWSKRHKQTPENPNAAADAYLQHGRGFDLQHLRGSYSQEWYRDDKLDISTATVRFPLPGGTYWERLIDQPARFGKKKARFGYGGSYAGQWWAMPKVTMAELAQAKEIWLAEGIFDAIALNQAPAFRDRGARAVSLMSCNNYPEAALGELRRAAAELGHHLPRLIFAFDVGAAGVRYTRDFVVRARKDGWTCGAAQVRPDGEGDKLDWNDLALADGLTAEFLEEALWNGEVTIAPDASAKALLIYNKDRPASFPLTFAGKQLWASFSVDRIQATMTSWIESNDPDLEDFKALPFEEQWNRAAAEAVEIVEVANCVFRTLYYQRDPNIEEGLYFLRIDFPPKPRRPAVKATFSGAACTASGEFTKRLASVAPGALWTGTPYQLVKLMDKQWATIRTVEALQFTGYSIDHDAWIFGDIAVHNGRVFEPNAEEYFELGKRAVKLRTTERILRISYDADKLDLSWVPHLVTAYGPKGIVTLAFFVLALFAEQVRRKQESVGFLEITGPPGTGKSTLLEFLWKVFGRANYEGFDPTKATNAGIARSLGQVANLPVVLIEGDRGQDTPHGRRFEWEELKTAYNGRPVRTRAIANSGMETFEPPFRAAIIIAQNAPVEGSPALLERIVAIDIDKSRFSPEGKLAGEALSAMDIERISGFPVHVARRGADILATYTEAFKRYEAAMLRHKGIRNQRLAKCHAQVAAMLDAMRLVVTNLRNEDVAETHAFILHMLEGRQRAIETDHPHVEWFWERFDFFRERQTDEAPIDHSRTGEVFAINLVEFEKKCADNGLRPPCTMNELKRLLKTSKARKFEDVKTVNSRGPRESVKCWVFRNPNHQPL